MYLSLQVTYEYFEIFCGCWEQQELCNDINIFLSYFGKKQYIALSNFCSMSSNLNFFCYTPLLLLRFGKEVVIIFEIVKKINLNKIKKLKIKVEKMIHSAKFTSRAIEV